MTTEQRCRVPMHAHSPEIECHYLGEYVCGAPIPEGGPCGECGEDGWSLVHTYECCPACDGGPRHTYVPTCTSGHAQQPVREPAP